MIARIPMVYARVMVALAIASAWVLVGSATYSAENDPEPILRIDTGGHSSYVTSLAWHPDGRQLWSAGWDKVIRVWRATDDGMFVARPEETIRLPIGPGPNGQISSIAASSDGRWLAIGGYASLVKRAASFRDQKTETAISSVELLEQGVIYVLDRTDNSFRRLEGHRGPVRRLSFAPVANGTEQLISAGFDTDANQKTVGSIRIWDVTTGRQVDGILLPEPPKNRPSIVVVGSSPQGAGKQVLAAWGSGKMYHWESSKPPQFRTFPDGMFNNLIVPSPDSKWVVTASANDATNEGQLTFWNVDAAGLPQRDVRRQVRFSRIGNEIYLPLGLTLLASRPGGQQDLLAVALSVLRLDSVGNWIPDRFQLRVLTVPNSGGLSRELVRKDLWKIDSAEPLVPDLAAIPKGQYLAIAGNPNHEILVYKISDLLQGQLSAQRLRGQTAIPEQIEFVDRQGELGLRILDRRAEAAGQQSKYVFDFSSNRIDSRDSLAWKTSQPNSQGWSASRAPDDKLSLNLQHQGIVRQTVRVPRRHIISSFVFTAPIDRTGEPLLIVAAHEEGQPWLGVFDAQDGALKRVFRAHTEPIVSLTVSGDSRLLATASADQTIAVWDISDIEAILQPRSTLAGVALIQKDQFVEVEQVQELVASSPLKAGDRLLGFLDPAHPDKLRKWPTVDDLYGSVLELAAGTKINIRRQNAGVVSDVPVTLQQAADERKPLFQLMITRQNSQGIRQWIGWSPLGPFDASDREIRQHLGWHFNVFKPKVPVVFAPLEEYPNLHRSGFLGDAVKNLGRPPAVVPLTLVEPRMSLKVLEPETDHWNDKGMPVIRQLPQAVTLQITNPEFTAELIKTIQLKVDDALVGSFSPSTKDRWQFNDLRISVWPRGEHRLRAELITQGDQPRTVTVDAPLDYLPPSPTIVPSQIPPSMTKESVATFAASVKPGSADVPIDIALVRLKEGTVREIVQTWKSSNQADNALSIESPLELSEGQNQFILEAHNVGATEATMQLEAASWRFEVFRSVRDKDPPTIEIAALEPLQGFDLGQFKLAPNQPLVVASESITLSGTIRAKENLTVATLSGNSLPGFASNSVKEFAFQAPLHLKPGLNTVRLAAKTDVSLETTLELNVLFRQQIPDVEIVQPIAEQVIDTLLAGATIELSAVFQTAANGRPILAVALVNGERVDRQFAIDLASGTIRGEIPLSLGYNSIQLQLSNDTGAEAQTRPLAFYYQPTPVVDDRKIPMEIEGSSFDVQLGGTSVTPIQRVLMDGRELPPSQWQGQQNGNRFTLRFNALPWQSDRKQTVLAVFAAGIDKPAFETVDLPKRKLPAMPPTVAFLSPSDSSSIASENIRIEYSIRSRTALSTIELLQDGRRISQPQIQPAEEGVDSVVREQVDVQLRSGLNTFQLVAENTDGLRSQSLTLNYIPSPVMLQLDSVTPTDMPDAPQKLALRADGSWGLAKPAESSRNMLQGRVRWNYRDDVKLNDPRLQVWVAVNGFKQPIRLQIPAADSLERAFRCEVQLFRPHDNVIEVMAPDLPELASTRAVVKVDCKSPELPRQRLHLVIVGVGVKQVEEAGLMKDAVSSLSGTDLRGVESRKEFVFKSPAFAECVGYGPYTGPVVSREKIGTLLEMIRLKIQQSQAREPASDVLLMYYRGGEQVYQGGQFYLTTRETQTAGDAEVLRNPLQLQYFAVSSDSLTHFVDRCPGTQLLLLDVARIALGDNVSVQAPEFIPGAATFRYAWLKGATVPADARLISAWQVAPQATRLGQIEQRLAAQHASLAQRYQGAISYENHLPEVLRDLVIGAQ